jgi:hypothetical protein
VRLRRLRSSRFPSILSTTSARPGVAVRNGGTAGTCPGRRRWYVDWLGAGRSAAGRAPPGSVPGWSWPNPPRVVQTPSGGRSQSGATRTDTNADRYQYVEAGLT